MGDLEVEPVGSGVTGKFEGELVQPRVFFLGGKLKENLCLRNGSKRCLQNWGKNFTQVFFYP